MGSPQVFVSTPESEQAGRAHLLSILPKARVKMHSLDFRIELRTALVNDPTLTLRQVAQALGVTRQYVGALVGPLGRPTCARHDKPGPKRDEAARRMSELELKVMSGQSAVAATKELGISLNGAAKLGFKARAFRPPAHGSGNRCGCNCWRCRKAKGIALPRGPKSGAVTRAEVEDWLAWTDPYDGAQLTQATIGRLAGTHQGAVSRIVRETDVA